MKKLIFLFIILLTTSIWSADYADSFSEYRIQIKNALGVSTSNTTWVTDSTMNDMIRQAIIAVSPIVKAKKETFSFVTTYRQPAYDLDTSVVGLITVYYENNDDVRTFLYAPKESWYQIFKDKTDKDFTDEPMYYDNIDNKLFLYPTPPQNGDTIKYEAFTRVLDISAEDSLSTIPQQYRTAILDYVCYRVAVLKQHPLVDVYYRNYQESIATINAILNRRGIVNEKPTP